MKKENRRLNTDNFHDKKSENNQRYDVFGEESPVRLDSQASGSTVCAFCEFFNPEAPSDEKRHDQTGEDEKEVARDIIDQPKDIQAE